MIAKNYRMCGVLIGLLLFSPGRVSAEVPEDKLVVEGNSQEEGPGEEHFSTGLDLSSLWSPGEDVVGPGFTWGLILISNKLEMELSVHSLVGGQVNSIPIGLLFKMPFTLGHLFVPYLGAGPVLIFDREKLRTTHDFAASAVLGLAFRVPQARWRIFLEGDYNFRFWQAYVHQGGLSAGFQYRF